MSDQNTQAPVAQKSLDDTKKGTSLKNIIAKFAPEGIDPQTYYTLINNQIMGTDARGNARPIEDMLFFLQTAKKLGLDPSLRQIYPVYRWDSRLGRERMIIQTGIDGFRLVAQRSQEYGGQDDAVYKVEELYNPITGETEKQLTATITVYKIVGNTRMPVPATARWNEYAQKAKDKQGKEYFIGMWSSMPYNQLAKCAEALALRKAFPQDLSGVYVAEEMDKERGDIKNLDLPAPKSVEDKKKAKAEAQQSAKDEGTKEANPADQNQADKPAEAPKLEKGTAVQTALTNFSSGQKKE